MTNTDAKAASNAPPLPLPVAAALQDDLLAACNDLDRLHQLIADACEALLANFSSAYAKLGEQRRTAGECGADAALDEIQQRVGNAVMALQFQDMSAQLIAHTHQRLRHCADRLARDTFANDEDGEAVVREAPQRPNPVTQDEMYAGSIELF